MAFGDVLLSLEGLSVGDALGASLFSLNLAEAVSRHELPPAPWRWTEDTQMALSVAGELRMRGYIDQDSLARHLAWRFTSDPARKYGAHTHQLLERVSFGESWRVVSRAQYSEGSFGSGAAARAIPIGGYFAGDPERAAREARQSAEVTHFHPEGTAGAVAAAVVAAMVAYPGHYDGKELLTEAAQFIPESAVRQGILKAAHIPAGCMQEAVSSLGSGRNHSAQDTLPFSLWCAAYHLHNYEEALRWSISGAGNLDTVCAIVGGIVSLAAHDIPREWIRRREPLPVGFEYHWETVLPPTQTGSLAPPSPDEPVLDVPVFRRNSLASVHKDSLTGLPNLLGLFDWLKQQEDVYAVSRFSLVMIQLFALRAVNRSQGRTAGDELLKRCTVILRRFSPLVFRVGGDRFAVVFETNDAEWCRAQAENIWRLLNYEDPDPNVIPARVGLVNFTEGEAVPASVLACLYGALSNRYYDTHQNRVGIFSVREIQAVADVPWMMVDLASQMMGLGSAADELLRMAQTDSVSQLPNMRAALNEIETVLNLARRQKIPLAVLLIDGDNLRQYNKISYEAGDDAIRQIGQTLHTQLRETDFLARWRTGDEFLVLLPGASHADAVQIGQRLCWTVEQASQAWAFHTTISIGIALYPEHGETVRDLIHTAEAGLHAAKQDGKNRVAVQPLTSR